MTNAGSHPLKILKARRHGLSPEMDRMNSIDTVRVLNRIARRHYHDDVVTYDHEKYLRECFACLQGFFATELNIRRNESDPKPALENAYLFSAMTYKSEGSNQIGLIKVTDADDDLGYYFAEGVKEELSGKFNPIIENLYEDIYAKRSISITEALLKDKREGKDLYLYSGQPYKPFVHPGKPPRDVDARISFFCTSDLAYAAGDSQDHFTERNGEEIEKFRLKLTDPNRDDPDVTKEKVGTLLWYYRQLQEAYLSDHDGQEFVVHFVRPSFIEFGYNILLSLGTNHRLEADQLAFIYLLVHKIVSQTLVERTRQEEKEVSTNYIFGIGHFLKHRISPVVSHLVDASKSLKKSHRIGNELASSIQLADIALASANVLDLFGKALAKRTTDKKYTEFSERTITRLIDSQSDPQDWEKFYLTIESIRVQALLIEIQQLIKTEWGIEIELVFTNNTDWKTLSVHPFIPVTDKWGRHYYVCPSKKIYHQFLHELFRNVSRSEHPLKEVTLSYHSDDQSMVISRAVTESDARNLRSLGIGYEEYSAIKKGGLSGLTLVQMYVDVLGIGTILHRLGESENTNLETKLVLSGLAEIAK
jgi:hypothetical protein